MTKKTILESTDLSEAVAIPWWVARAIADETPLRKSFCVGGLGSGKSHGGQIWDLYRCLQNGVPLSEAKRSLSWTVAPNYRIAETLLELTLQVAQDVFKMKDGEHFDLKRSFPRVIDFRRSGLNHRMMFLSANNPEHFVSESITHWRWSEVGVSKAIVLEKLTDRLRDMRARVLQGLGDGTPETQNHYYDWCGFCGWQRDAIDPKSNIRVYRVETADNLKYLAPGYLEGLKAQYGYSKERLLSYTQGIFTNHFANSAHWEFVESRNTTLGVEPSPSLTVMLTFDFNVSPLAWVVIQKFKHQKNYYSPREDKYVAVKEASGEARGLMDAIADFGAKFPLAQYRHTPIEVYGDASGWARNIHSAGSDYTAIETYLKTLGYQNVSIVAARSNPMIKHRLEKVAAMMAYERFAVDTQGCPNLVKSFVKTLLKEGTFEIEKPQGEDWSHWSDACDYCLYQVAKDIDLANPSARRSIGTS